MPASQKFILLGAVVAACAGFYLWGYSETAPPKTVTVQVPVVHTVTKTETVEVQKELPSVCLDLYDQATQVYTSTGGMSKAAGNIKLALSDLGRAAWKGDVAKINDVSVVILEQNNLLSAATVDQGEATTAFQTSLKACEEALKE